MCDRNLVRSVEAFLSNEHFEHISADHGEVSLFVLLPLCGPDWCLIFCAGSFSGRNMEQNTLQILMLCQLMNQSYRKNYSFWMSFFFILFETLCSSKLTLRFTQRRGRLGVLSEFTRSCRFPRWLDPGWPRWCVLDDPDATHSAGIVTRFTDSFLVG